MSLDPEWGNDEKSNYDIGKLLDTPLLRDKDDQDIMSWQMAKLVGLYICKNSISRRSYLIANLVAGEASETTNMKPEEFVAAIKPILRVAAIDFTKAVFKTGFMDQLYSDTHYEEL